MFVILSALAVLVVSQTVNLVVVEAENCMFESASSMFNLAFPDKGRLKDSICDVQVTFS